MSKINNFITLLNEYRDEVAHGSVAALHNRSQRCDGYQQTKIDKARLALIAAYEEGLAHDAPSILVPAGCTLTIGEPRNRWLKRHELDRSHDFHDQFMADPS